MRAVVQRVQRASVEVDGDLVGEIEQGLVVLLGIANTDTPEEAVRMAKKVDKLRIFEDAQGRMNLSVTDVQGSVLAVSQFTLLADTCKGNRPSFLEAARPESAAPLYELFCEELTRLGRHVARGVFGAHMHLSLVNDGPVTISLEV